MTVKFGESGHPVFRASSPLSRGTLKSKRVGKLSILFCADGDTIETFFAESFLSISSVSTEQLQNCVKSTVYLPNKHKGDPLWQSNPTHFFAPADLLIMTPTSSVEILAQENLLQKHKERVENLSQPDQLIKVCTDAGFLKTVEVGQYFVTRHTDEFSQFAEPVTCREYTLHEMTNQLIRTKSQVLAWVIITSRRRNWNWLENCQKYAFSFFFQKKKMLVFGTNWKT